MAHKKSAMPLMRIARGESVGILLEPLSVISCTTLKACASLKDRTGGYHLRFTCHLLLSCLLYQLEFPTLFLAMRDIIVMHLQSGFLPEPAAKLQKSLETNTLWRKKLQKKSRIVWTLVLNLVPLRPKSNISMGSKDKLVERFKKKPKDFTYKGGTDYGFFGIQRL